MVEEEDDRGCMLLLVQYGKFFDILTFNHSSISMTLHKTVCVSLTARTKQFACQQHVACQQHGTTQNSLRVTNCTHTDMSTHICAPLSCALQAGDMWCAAEEYDRAVALYLKVGTFLTK